VNFLVDETSQGFAEQTTVHIHGLSSNDVAVQEGTGGTTPSKQAVGGVVVQQAVALDTPLAHIVLAESKADVHGICTPA
jgi:hypothetical protein